MDLKFQANKDERKVVQNTPEHRPVVKINTKNDLFLKTQTNFSGDVSRNLVQSVEVQSNGNTGSSINGSTIMNAVGDLLQIYNLQAIPKPNKISMQKSHARAL